MAFRDPTSGRKLCWDFALGKCSAAGGCKMVHDAGSVLTELKQKLKAAGDGPVAPARRPSVTSGAPSRTSSALAARETVLRERTIVVMREARERAARASEGVYRQASHFCVAAGGCAVCEGRLVIPRGSSEVLSRPRQCWRTRPTRASERAALEPVPCSVNESAMRRDLVQFFDPEVLESPSGHPLVRRLMKGLKKLLPNSVRK